MTTRRTERSRESERRREIRVPDEFSYEREISEARREAAEARKEAADARRESAEARRESAEARRRIEELFMEERRRR